MYVYRIRSRYCSVHRYWRWPGHQLCHRKGCGDVYKRQLKERLDIPVFHDDQHGTAVITVSAMLNALKLVGKKIEEVSAVVNGAGAAGTACTKLLMALGLRNVVVCDKNGALVPGLPGMTPAQAKLAEETNPQRKSGTRRM